MNHDRPVDSGVLGKYLRGRDQEHVAMASVTDYHRFAVGSCINCLRVVVELAGGEFFHGVIILSIDAAHLGGHGLDQRLFWSR